MTKKDDGPTPLQAAIIGWLGRAVPAALAASMEWGRQARYGFYPIRDDQGAGKALAQILALLPGKNPLKSPEDVGFVLRSELVTSARDVGQGKSLDELDWNAILVQLETSPLRPARTWKFSVPIAVASQLPMDHSLGGRNKLALRTQQQSEDSEPVLLSGDVIAATENRVAFTVENLSRSVIGLSFAAGIAGILPRASDLAVNLSLKPLTPFAPTLHPSVTGLVARTFFIVPTDLDAIEQSLVSQARVPDLVTRRLDRVVRVVQSSSATGTTLASAAALLFDALAARDEGSAIAFALMSMEACLLEKSDATSTVARLSEAVTFRLGPSAQERAVYRKTVKTLYDARSAYVHTGHVNADRWRSG